MNTEKAIKRRRSIRKFKDKEVPYKTLKEIVNSGRLAPSAMNRQPSEYLIVDDQELVKRIFSSTSWAGFLD